MFTMDKITEQQTVLDDMMTSIDGKISTMTIMLYTHGCDEHINLLTIKDALHDIETPIILNPKSKFHNALVFNVGNQSVKLFCNGNIHITGVKQLYDAQHIGDMFMTILGIVYGKLGHFSVVRYDIQLINVGINLHIGVDTVLNLSVLIMCLKERGSFYTSYNTERHSGVIVKAPTFSVLIFESGNVIITSVKSVEQIEAAHKYIKTNVVPHLERCVIDKVQATPPPVKRPKFNYDDYIVLR
jgi:TATA-box binding protein (TBP) (component of TFIID and TFIIIB)